MMEAIFENLKILVLGGDTALAMEICIGLEDMLGDFMTINREQLRAGWPREWSNPFPTRNVEEYYAMDTFLSKVIHQIKFERRKALLNLDMQDILHRCVS